jgi:hypothetical protein
MIVVGTSAPPEGFHISICNGHDFLTWLCRASVSLS